jgi:PAS domain S-box-containing protein
LSDKRPAIDELATEASTNRRFRHLLEVAPDAIIEVDGNGLITFSNVATQRLFGYTDDELLGRDVDDLVPKEVRGRHAHHRANYCAHPLTRPMGSGLQLQGQRKDGSRFPVEISLSPYESAEGFRIGAIIRDVTERVKAEEQITALHRTYAEELTAANRQLEVRNREVEAANQLKSEFLASMSHELRTPLHTIIGFAELLSEGLEGPLNDKQMRFVNHILTDGRHLLELINDILDLSKIESGHLKLNFESFDWTRALNEVLGTIQPQAVVKGVELSNSDLEPDSVEADRVRFKEILFNLLSNAVKFTPSGGRVWVEIKADEETLELSVRDTGIGISSEQQSRIFDKFYQTGMTTKGVREGTGLGLAITKHLVDRHGGTISLESIPGTGSTFTIRLPRHAPDEGRLADRPDTTINPTILIVESDTAARELLVSYLEPQGYRTVVATTRDEAVSKARDLRPDAITLDLLMPSSDGWETLRELRRTPATASIPVLVVSVVNESGSTVSSTGAAAYLLKPVNREMLLDTLRQHVRPRPGKPPKILVVDDEQSSRDLLQEVLGGAGYLPILNSSGREALETLAKTHVSAVIVDLMMPGMNGFEFIFRIKDHPELQGLPLVVLTAKDLTGQDVDVLRRDTKAVLLKGATWREQLVSQLRAIVHASGKDAVGG